MGRNVWIARLYIFALMQGQFRQGVDPHVAGYGGFGSMRFDFDDQGDQSSKETPVESTSSTAPDPTISATIVEHNIGLGSTEFSQNVSSFAVFGVDMSGLCPGSCGGRCWRTKSCSCLPTCELRGDCCLDYFEKCKVLGPGAGTTSQSNETRNPHSKRDSGSVIEGNILAMVEPTDIASWNTTPTCQRIRRGSSYFNMWVVMGCPNDTLSLAHKLVCENPSSIADITDRYSLVKVSGAYLFKNKFCARCNGVSLDDTSVSLVKPSFGCDSLTGQAELTYRRDGYNALISFLGLNCAPVYSTLHVSARDHTECPPGMTLVDTCDPEYADEMSNYGHLSKACQAYSANVVAQSYVSGTVYKNPHCAYCNGLSSSELRCPGEVNITDGHVGDSTFPTFSLLLNFDGSHKVSLGQSPVCQKGSSLDLALDTCIDSVCPIGQVLLFGNCTNLELFDSVFSRAHDREGVFSIIFQLQDTLDFPADTALLYITVAFELTATEDGTEFRNATVDEGCSLLVAAKYHATMYINVTGVDDTHHLDICVVVELLTSGEIDISMWRTIERAYATARLSGRVLNRDTFMEKLRQGGMAGKLNRIQNVKGIHLLNHDPLSLEPVQDAQSNTTRVQDGHAAVVIETYEAHTNYTPLLALLWPDSGFRLRLDSVPVMLSWSNINGFLPMKRWDMQVLTRFCPPEIVSCEKVFFSESEIIAGDDFLRLKASESAIHTGSYARVEGGGYAVCLYLLEEAFIRTPNVKGILTLCGLSVSLVGLAVTLFSYSLFASLRTRPGLCIMNLCTALFVAQLVFEVAPVSSGNGRHGVACFALGAIEHYAWVAAFLWMNVLAFDALMTFTSKLGLSTAQLATPTCTSARFRSYLFYAWATPAVLVAACLGVHYSGIIPFRYIDLNTCWLESGRTMLLGFGLPLATIVLLNTVLFVKTAVSLHAQMSRDVGSVNDDDRGELIVYVKLFSVLGLSWLLGFVAAVTRLEVVTYIFIAANTLHGVFICLSFGLTSRVRKLYRQRLAGVLQRWRSSKGNTSTSSTQSSAADDTSVSQATTPVSLPDDTTRV